MAKVISNQNVLRRQNSDIHHSNVAQSNRDSDSDLDQSEVHYANHGLISSSSLFKLNQIVIDSGASKHMSSQKEWFIDYKEIKVSKDMVLGN